MPFNYTNRRGRTYYLHSGTTKTGKQRFFFSRKPDGTLADAAPAGYEVYENPNAGVFLRKKLRSNLSEEEVELVRRGIKHLAGLRPFEYKIDVSKNTITIYLIDQDMDEIASLFSEFMLVKKFDPERRARDFGTYSAMMRFHLRDEKKRVFDAERYCFRGSVDDWVPVGSPTKLETLVNKLVKHLGKESFYDILPYGF